MDTQDIAKQVQERAESLLIDEGLPELEDEFIKQCLDTNERGDGCLYATMNRGRCLYNTTPKDGEWYHWGGHCWELDHFRRSMNAVEPCALEYERLADQLKEELIHKDIKKGDEDGWKISLEKKYRARAERLRSSRGAKNAMAWAPVVDPSMACLESDLDKHPWLLPVANGVVNLKTGVLEHGRPEDLLTRSLDLEYDPHADYAPWQEVVEEIAGSAEVASFTKRSLGYAITGFSHEQYIWVFVGPGRNGKGILFSLVGEVMGPYYHEINKAMILEQRNEPGPAQASEHKYSLLGKRIIVGAETNKGQKIDAGAVKGLTGEDMVTCRPNFRSEISFKPTHSLFLHTNHIPYGLARDFALVQRLLRIEFPNMYVDDIEAEARKHPGQAHRFRQKDPELKDKLRLYRQGILRWLVEGCLEWQEQGLAPPASVLQGVDELAKEEDYMGQFIEDCLIHEPDGGEHMRIPCQAVYDTFSWWWSQNMDPRSQRLPAMKTLNGGFRDRGYTVERKGGKYWLYFFRPKLEIQADVDEYVLKRGYKS